MKPIHAATLSFCALYLLCLALHTAAVGAAPAGAGVAWYVWHASGAICLSAAAVELVAWAMWLRIRHGDAGTTSGGVPLRLTPLDRLALLRERPPIALLMPAHNEATTADDRAGLVARISDTILRTPSYSTFFLLADSPPSQRDNELDVIAEVKRRLRDAGRGYFEDRVVLEEYRNKPPAWRHKCGSLLTWLRRHGREFEYMFVLDADSSLPEPDPRRPETCDVVERMAVAMQEDRGLALVQASIQVRDYQTLWGWVQGINTLIGSDYYFRIFSHVYGREAPCYGHNCLIRVSDFAAYAKNTLHYTSHDHIDSSDLAASGRGCVLTDAAVTYEQPEDTLPGWLKRECRWSRGNGQWLVYLLRKRPLPLAAAVYLALGILQYFWALLAGSMVVSAAVLVHEGVPLVARPEGAACRLLIGIVLFALLVPKLVASRTLPQFLATVGATVVIGSSVALCQGLAFLMGAFGSKWVPRGARGNGFDLGQALSISVTFFPAMILGLFLWGLIGGRLLLEPAGVSVLLAAMVAGLILSPVTSLVLSWPIGRHTGAPAPKGGVASVFS
jgi:Glycosyl transferase family group 2